MRFLYCSLLFLFCSSSLFAQIEIAPLTSNPILQNQELKNKNNNTTDIALARMTADCPDPNVVDTTFGTNTTIYVISGETAVICIDQLAFNVLDTISCLNCDDLDFGTVTIGPGPFCYYYTSNSGLEAETSDIMEIEACDLDGCTTLEFPIVVKRADNTFTQPLIPLAIETTVRLCLPFPLDLPGTERNYFYNGCSAPNLGTLSPDNDCVNFTSKRFGELTEVCVEVCDEFCVCDTYIFPIQINAPTLQLPFYEDFSYDGPFPDKNLWLDDNVYVNAHLPNQPPSVGVATFDGLDQTGLPYGGRGAADYLTSAYIDLNGLSAADNVYLSYFIQPKGISFFFPLPQDSLVLQFRNDTMVWESIALYTGLSASTSPLAVIPFTNDDTTDTYIKTHHIKEEKFLHDKFQFRFINHCKRSGLNYLWHLDYVRIAENEIPDGRFKDVAFTNTPSSLLKEYRHMPWNHFDGFANQELATTVDIEIYNNDRQPLEISSTVLNVTNRLTSSNIFSKDPLLLAVPVNQFNALSNEHAFYTNSMDFSSITIADPGDDKLILDMTYEVIQGEQILSIPGVTRNDRVTSKTIFSNYFAYDDGTAEAMITTGNINTQIATQFHTNVADQLRGVQFNFPYTGTNLNGDFVIKVWLEDITAEPIYTSPTYSVIQAEQFYDTLNAFSTYRLLSEELEETMVDLPAGTFHVGIQLVSSGDIGVGYDINSPRSGDFQLFKAAGSTSSWDTIIQPGALMIRPIVGPESLPTTSIKEARADQTLQVKVFPNPATDRIYLPVNQDNTSTLQLQIVSSTGQVLVDQAWEPEIELNQWTNGLYFIWLRDLETGAQIKEKFLILR